jgi:hypothetical protein
MNKEPEALRLAAHAEANSNFGDMKSIAAELRRLHEAHEWQYTMAGQRLRRIEKLKALNQELLAALNEVYTTCDWYCDDGQEAMIKARAAIAKAEGEQNEL